MGKTILQVHAESRLTVAVGIMIGVTIGLVTSSGRGVVSAAIVIALQKCQPESHEKPEWATYLAIGAGAVYVISFSGSG